MATIPGAPTNLNVVNICNLSILTWDVPSNNGGSPISNYIITYFPTSNPSIVTTINTNSVSNTYTISPLTGANFLTYNVYAVNSIGQSATAATFVGANSFVPNPPRLWSRYIPKCVNCASDQGYANCAAGGFQGQSYSTYELDQRRKVEILKYKANSANTTKAQQYSQAARNMWTRRSRTWATQTESYTNPNVQNLPEVKIPINNVFTAVSLVCRNPNNPCNPTSDSDVPGPVIPLCVNNNIPLTNYIVTRTYLAGGTKWPENSKVIKYF